MNIMSWVIQSITLTFPLLAAGFSLVLVLKKRWLLNLDLPLDGRMHFRQRRVFGDNKTVKGLIVLTVGSIIATYALHYAQISYPAVLHPIFSFSPFALGLLYATGYVAGELLNSFIKRQIGVPPGLLHPTNQATQRMVDLADGILMTALIIGLLWPRYSLQMLAAAIIGVGLHYMIEKLMQALKIKPVDVA